MSLVNFLGPKTKTPSVKTLGVLLFGLCLSADVRADCMPSGSGEMVVVDRVYDGDTIKLEDGRHIRVLGINAPEVDHGKNKTGQPLGDAARAAVEAFFNRDKQARLFYDVQRVDRYERTLAHVYDTNGKSLSAELLRQGLGFHVAIPPNLSLNECLHGQETIARAQHLGVWGSAEWQAKPAAAVTETGFQRITGRVVRVRLEQSIWLDLDGPLSIKITPSDKANFPKQQNWIAWKGRMIEVRGWVTDRNGSESAQKKGGSSKHVKQSAFIVQPRIAGALELLE